MLPEREPFLKTNNFSCMCMKVGAHKFPGLLDIDMTEDGREGGRARGREGIVYKLCVTQATAR